MNKTILVTGGLGYIGSHTVVELQKNAYNVVVVDDLSNSKKEVAERITAITGKPIKLYILVINDRDGMIALQKVINKHSVSAIVSLPVVPFMETLNNHLLMKCTQ